ncbi:c-type cytochrome [Granulosicoccus sp. 3-233]|uniref:c-type cytochrome n=1 Tax=Granulosicoccus sp. 3-233 TaxID=3417969 RepID=UPI003D35460B
MRHNTMGLISRSASLVRGTAAVLLTIGLSVGAVQAGGDAEAGAEKSATCAACHGAQGIGEIASYPILAGQYASYLEHALKSYRDGSRDNAIMAGFATALSDEDIADLAAYFSSQPGPLQTAILD